MAINHIELTAIQEQFDELGELMAKAGMARDAAMDEEKQLGEFGHSEEHMARLREANEYLQTSTLRLISRQLLWVQLAMTDKAGGPAVND
jgi:hypothetical protein